MVRDSGWPDAAQGAMMGPVPALPRDPDPRHARWEAAFSELERRSPRGQAAHLFFACLAMFGAGLPTTIAESCVWPVAICGLARLPWTRRVAASCFIQPFFWLVVAWSVWGAASLLWSPNVEEGIDQLAGARFALITISIWPVIRHRGLLIGALLAGYFAGNIAQLVEITTAWEPNPMPGRDSGWWEPAVAGSLMMVPLGFHVAGVIGKDSSRPAVAVGLAGSVVTLLAIAATGTRGAWIATAFVLLAAIMIGLGSFKGRARTVAISIAVVISLGAGTLFLGSGLAQRVSEGASEVRAAVQEGDYDSSTGRRIQMFEVSRDAFLDHPLQGVGAGGFEHYWDRWLEDRDLSGFALAHAHSGIAHAAATGGVIGLVMAPLVFASAFAGVLRQRGIRGYADGAVLVALGLGIIGVCFDTLQVNQQTAMAVCLIAAISGGWRPRAYGRELDSVSRPN